MPEIGRFGQMEPVISDRRNRGLWGAGTPNRTGDLPLTRRLLYQLSYAGEASAYFTILRRVRPAAGGLGGSASASRLATGMAGAATRAAGASTVKNAPCPFSRAKMPCTRSTGMLTSRDTPLKRAENWISSLLIVRLRVALRLTFSTISPFFTYSIGTRVRSSTRTLRYGVYPQSEHHS